MIICVTMNSISDMTKDFVEGEAYTIGKNLHSNNRDQ